MPQEAVYSVNDLPTSPSSPRWEGPRHSAPSTREHPTTLISLDRPKQPTSQRLKKLTFRFCDLIRSNPAVSAVDGFLADWCTVSAGDGESALHSLVAKWFGESMAVETCFGLAGERKDLVRLLLAYGIRINDRAMRALMYDTLKTRDTDLLEWLMDHGQWEINRSVPGHDPPALG